MESSRQHSLKGHPEMTKMFCICDVQCGGEDLYLQLQGGSLWSVILNTFLK